MDMNLSGKTAIVTGAILEGDGGATLVSQNKMEVECTNITSSL